MSMPLPLIRAGTFIFTEDFPHFRFRKTLRLPFNARTCGDVFDAFLHHEAARVKRGDLAPVTVAAHRQILDHVWRPAVGAMSLFAVRYSTLVEVADGYRWTKRTYNNAISALRRAFDFGFQDHPEYHNPARALKSARIRKKDRPAIDPFSIQDAETLITAIHCDWGEAQGNYDELIRGHLATPATPDDYRFSVAVHPTRVVPVALNGYGLWVGLMLLLTLINYGFPIAYLMNRDDTSVPIAHRCREMSTKGSANGGGRWFTTAIAATLLIALVSMLTGFLWLPFSQPDSPFQSVWDAICSSAGLIRNRPVTDIACNTSYRTSTVVISPDLLRGDSAESIGRGRYIGDAVHDVSRRARVEQRQHS